MNYNLRCVEVRVVVIKLVAHSLGSLCSPNTLRKERLLSYGKIIQNEFGLFSLHDKYAVPVGPPLRQQRQNNNYCVVFLVFDSF